MEITKIPLDDVEKMISEPIKFCKMPIQYLEIVENKLKVKKEEIGKFYTPPPEEEEEEINIVDETIPEQTEINSRLHNLLGPDTIPKVATLSELQAQNPQKNYIQTDYRYPTEETEEDKKERSEVYFHYEVLRRMHPNATIPEFTMHSDPKVMAQKYQLLAKKLSLNTSVDNWKRYMIVFVMGCEVVLGKLHFDMEGFAQQQIMSMSTYDQLLVEMAEKSYVPSGNSKWPVEARLLMMLTMNVVLFIISKIIMKKTGTNLLGTINNLNDPPEKTMKEP